MTIAELEEALKEEARVFLNRAQGLRTPHTEDLFQRRVYIGPEDLVVENYLRRRPLAAFNPGPSWKGTSSTSSPAWSLSTTATPRPSATPPCP